MAARTSGTRPARQLAGAANATARTITDYAPDPNGLGLVARLAGVLQRGISGHTGLVYLGDKGAPSVTFGGDLGANPQTLVGAAPLALYGAVPAVHPRSGDIGGTVSADALNDGTLRIFAARARRQGQGLA